MTKIGSETGEGRAGAQALSCLPQVSAVLADGALVLRLGNIGARAARFVIEAEESRVLDVAGEEVVSLLVENTYGLVVQGPDRFRFELSGSLEGAAAGVDVQARHAQRGAYLELRNDGDHEVRLNLRSLSCAHREEHVRVAAGGAQPLHWPGGQHGDYDLEITTPDDDTYRRRIAGRTPTP